MKDRVSNVIGKDSCRFGGGKPNKYQAKKWERHGQNLRQIYNPDARKEILDYCATRQQA